MPLVSIAGPRAKRYTELTGGGGGGAGNVGQVGPYAALNLAAFPIYTIDMGLNDYQVFATQGGIAGSGSHSHVASAWPLGGTGYCRITPPTTAGYERGILIGNLWRNFTLGIQDFNLRYEWRTSPNFFSYNGDGSKYVIIHTRNDLAAIPGDSGPQDRPVIFLQKCNQHGGQYDRANTAVFGPACETAAGYCPNTYGETGEGEGGTVSGYLTMAWSFYLTNSTDTGTFQGAPKIPAGEIITIEMRVVTKPVPGYSRGLLGYRVYRENGTFFEKTIAYNWDTNFHLNSYIYEVQQFGMGQFNTVPGPNAAYADVGGYITVARDFGGWLGRRNA
jgi:hypothetical protein